MSASELQRAEWPDPDPFFLGAAGPAGSPAQASAVGARERLKPREAEGLRLAWQRYCKVIAELERASAEFESLRAYAR